MDNEGEVVVDCQQKVIDQSINGKIFFCLLYKEYLQVCPSMCPYKIPGECLTIDYVYTNNLDMECQFFHVLGKSNTKDKRSFVCEITGHFPICKDCPFYLSSLVRQEDYGTTHFSGENHP